MTNLGLLFNKEYYRSLGTDKFADDVKKINGDLFGAQFDQKRDYVPSPVAGAHKFLLETAYPGLMIGTGNPHGTKKADSDINVGFSFDYTSGLPIIPASSVKGVLRSHFKNRREAVAALTGLEQRQLSELETEIFEGEDIFLDAVIFDGNEYCNVLACDYITPHKYSTKNPIPILMIKIPPEVRFEFRFRLKNGVLTVNEKLKLFSNLLQLFGVGSKTNVGYGVLNECDAETRPKKTKQYSSEKPRNNKLSEKPERSSNNSGTDERMKCPHCGKWPFKYNRQGKPNRFCFYCKEELLGVKYV